MAAKGNKFTLSLHKILGRIQLASAMGRFRKNRVRCAGNTAIKSAKRSLVKILYNVRVYTPSQLGSNIKIFSGQNTEKI